VTRDELTGHYIVSQPIRCSALQRRFAASPRTYYLKHLLSHSRTFKKLEILIRYSSEIPAQIRRESSKSTYVQDNTGVPTINRK
jgi:hypothetical protein